MSNPISAQALPLHDKVAIITGSGRGLGASTALRLAHDGCNIVINDLNKENVKLISEQISKIGRKVFLSNHDVSDSKSANLLVEEVKNYFGKIDILVNNAGITRDAMMHKLAEDQWDEVIRVNL